MNLYENIKDLEEAYKNFLLDTDINRLELLSDQPNIFKILKLERQEIRHSNFLAWLLTPNESHGLEDIFFKRFFRELIYQHNDINLIEFEEITEDEVVVFREFSNIDIFIETNKFIIVIENKVDSQEHSDQLTRYKKIVEDKFNNKKGIYIYLTSVGYNPSEVDYIPASYASIEKYLCEILELYNEKLSLKIQKYIEDYIFIIRNEILGNNETYELSKKIYKKHKMLIDTLFEVKQDSTSIIKPYVLDWINQKEYVLGSDSKGFVRFLTPELEKIIPKRKSSFKNNESFLFEIHLNYSSGKKMRCYATISSGDNESVIILKPILDKLESKSPKGETWLTYFNNIIEFEVDLWAMEEDKNIKEEVNKILNEFNEKVVEKVEEAILSNEDNKKNLETLKNRPLL